MIGAQAVKNLVGGTAAALGLDRAARRRDRGGARSLYVLAYHRIDEPKRRPDLDPQLISASATQFEEQMRTIARHLCPVAAEDVLEAARGGVPLPRNAVLVTFDDGYRDFQEHAAPAALRHGVRPLLFVATAHVGGELFWWDQLYRIVAQAPGNDLETSFGTFSIRSPEERRRVVEIWRRRVRASTGERERSEIEERYAACPAQPDLGQALLGWDDLRGLAAAGVTVAAHSHTHPLLGWLPPELVRLEVRTAREHLSRNLGGTLPLFAYPDGRAPLASGDGVERVLREEGIELAFTMREGRAALDRDPLLRLPRISVSPTEGLGLFRMHLTPRYDRWKRS